MEPGRASRPLLPSGEKSATQWPWRSFSFTDTPETPAEDFFLRPTETVARELLGCYLRSTLHGSVVAGVIVETEAYLGPEDPASHAATRKGRTKRNASMFGPPGHAYVYRSYGMHWCLNVVAGEVGVPSAVLVRALDPTSGAEVMAARRSGRRPLCSGPGRLAEALGISGEMDGHSLSQEPLRLLLGWRVPESEVGISGRIGIRQAADQPLRFFLRGHPEVSGRPR
jgi:DNA-3-methyladenine glycosylase